MLKLVSKFRIQGVLTINSLMICTLLNRFDIDIKQKACKYNYLQAFDVVRHH